MVRNRRPPHHPNGSAFVNISGDYRYMSEGHYESVEAEIQEIPVYPRIKESLDAYVVPLCMERAKKAEISIPEYYISNGYFEPPAIVYPINPFMRKHSVVYKEGHVKTIGKSLTRNYKYPICVQKIKEEASIREFKCIMGTTSTEEYDQMASRIWNLFHLPICKVRVIENGESQLSAVEPLPLHQLRPKELKLLRKANEWQI
jgi:hypothetical protein